MANKSWLDRAFEAVAPIHAEKRHAARNRIARATATRNLYDAASMSRRTQGWRVVGSDANSETRPVLGRLRDAARDMVRNNPHAQRAKTVISRNVVGAGIIPQVKATTPKRADKIKALIDKHFDSTDIDADGRLNLYGLQELVMATVVEAGECLVRKRPRRAEDGYALPFQLQVLEPDFLDTGVDGEQGNGNFAIQGVEYDKRGRRVAYYLFDTHPGAMIGAGAFRTRGRRVSADFVAHVYRVDRPGQVRGVTWFAPVMVAMRDYADYADAQLMRQKIAACFAAFVQRKTHPSDFVAPPAPTGEPLAIASQPTAQSPYPVETFEPGMISYLEEGEEITFATPPSTSDFGPFTTVSLRAVAVGMGISAEAFTGDMSNTNYSSGKMGRMEFDRNIDSWTWNMLIPQMMDPLQAWTIEAAEIVTASTEPFTLGWTPPRRVMIDPSTEIAAEVSAIRAGLSSRSAAQRRLGLDPEQVHAEIKQDNETADKEGFVFDTDPRLTNSRGAFQKGGDANTDDANADDEPTTADAQAPKDVKPSDVSAKVGTDGAVQDAAFNGAQITAIKDIVLAVANGEMPKETAIALIQVGFPSIDETKAKSIVDPITPKAAPDDAPALSPAPSKNDDTQAGSKNDDAK